jgi:predicted nucleic-acid-binding Zn-ribbon protein
MNFNQRKCPECDGTNLFVTETSSGGGHGPMLLPGLGGFMRLAKFRVRVCADCGLTRFYADPDARVKLPGAKAWRCA